MSEARLPAGSGGGYAPGAVAPRWWRGAVQGAAWVAVLGMVAVAVAVALAGGPDGSPARLAAAGLDGLGALALLGRRRWPVGVLLAEVTVAAFTGLLTATFAHKGSILLVVLALYLVATVRPAGQAIGAGVVSELVIGVATALHSSALLQALGGLASEVAVLTAALAVGVSVRSQRSLVESFRERAEHAEQEQRWGSARAVAAERVRIARELHDVVAHHVSLLVVQAGAVRESIPAEHLTRPVLDSMIDGGRRAMGELRDMLGALRLDDRSDTVTPSPQPPETDGVLRLPQDVMRLPQPTIEQVPDLVDGARCAGIPVTYQVVGADHTGDGSVHPPVAAVVSLSVYRIVQEALTNIVKHAPGAFTVVRLTYEVDAVEIVVRNGTPPRSPRGRMAGFGVGAGAVGTGCGPGLSAARGGGGHGITGMAERASLGHGTLQIGPTAGGWEVCARFPRRASDGPTAPAGVPVGRQHGDRVLQ